MFVSAIPYADGPTSEGNYRVYQGSPDIDAGNDRARNLPDTDLDGEDRLQDGTVDMGAYEGGEVPPHYFVNRAAGPDGDGTSWENAFQLL